MSKYVCEKCGAEYTDTDVCKAIRVSGSVGVACVCGGQLKEVQSGC